MFSLGYTVQAALNVVAVLRSLPRRPTLLRSALINKVNLKLATFLGGYSAVFAVSEIQIT